MPRLFLVRHAPTAANVAGVFQGQADIPALPVEEPERHQLDLCADVRLFSSPLARAVTAAGILLPGHQPMLDRRLMERSVGEWEGLDHAAVRRRWPESYVDGAIDPLVTPPGGESMHAFCARVLVFLTDLAETPGADQDATTCVVTHNGWIRAARLVNRDLAIGDLFSTSEPFLEPIPFRLAPEAWHNPFPSD